MPRKSIYPWDKWFYFGKLRLVQGRNFNCAPYIMAQQVRNAAQRYDCSISINIEDDALEITIKEKGE